jgi:hypothetical protein
MEKKKNIKNTMNKRDTAIKEKQKENENNMSKERQKLNLV